MACYTAQPPLVYDTKLGRAARFHSHEMKAQSYFEHNSMCTLNVSIDNVYPDQCLGQASCACKNGASGCNPTCTTFGGRVSLFGGQVSSEIIADAANVDQAFYLWLYEKSSSTQCTRFSSGTETNGHRYSILKETGAVGYGNGADQNQTSGRYSTGDFSASSDGAVPKVPSGAHYPRQAASVDVWANWYDTAGPVQALVNVDGTCQKLERKRGTDKSGAWSATVTGVGSGCHRYYFVFKDQAGTQVLYPSTGSLAIGSGAACPDYDEARPALGTGCSTETQMQPDGGAGTGTDADMAGDGDGDPQGTSPKAPGCGCRVGGGASVPGNASTSALALASVLGAAWLTRRSRRRTVI